MKEMSTSEAIDMMKRCREEIVSLKAQIAFLAPKADAYDNLAAVLRLLPRGAMAMGENVVWTIDKRVRELEELQKGAVEKTEKTIRY